jgi:hypothetical protein
VMTIQTRRNLIRAAVPGFRSEIDQGVPAQ